MSATHTGTLHLVGVGPGDPELLTLRAVRVLRSVHVVAYPSTGEGAAFARDIAARHILPGAVLLPVTSPVVPVESSSAAVVEPSPPSELPGCSCPSSPGQPRPSAEARHTMPGTRTRRITGS